MKLVPLALNAFLPRILGEADVLMSDNATVVAYLKKQWGTVSKVLCSLAQETVTWTELHLVTSFMRYIPGNKNILAY